MEADLNLNECYASLWRDFMDLFHSLDPNHLMALLSFALLITLFSISFIFYLLFFSKKQNSQNSSSPKDSSTNQGQQSISSSPQTPNRKSSAGLETFASAQVSGGHHTLR
jgi:hypothetical protein